jgi:glycosyltransferase involved in cell wall biosynthesis
MSIRMWDHSMTANQYPERANSFSRAVRSFASLMPPMFSCPTPTSKPQGISAYMRVKDEKDWIGASIASLSAFADEIIIVDNGSTDGTFEILRDMAHQENGRLKLWQKPELYHADLSNFAMEQTTFRWVFRFDGDMIAHNSGPHNIEKLRSRVFALNPNRYYLIYLRHINLSGDLFHQDPREMVHIEEYIHTFSKSARFIHPGRFEAVRFPFYYKPLFWYEPYVFHVNVKPARRMLLRYFWEDWMELKDYLHYPTLEDYVMAHIDQEFGTSLMEEAQTLCVNRMIQNHIPFDPERFGPYPELLKPSLKQPKYLIHYENGRISGRKN